MLIPILDKICLNRSIGSPVVNICTREVILDQDLKALINFEAAILFIVHTY